MCFCIEFQYTTQYVLKRGMYAKHTITFYVLGFNLRANFFGLHNKLEYSSNYSFMRGIISPLRSVR